MYVIDEIKLEQFQKLLAISEIDWVTIVGTKTGILFAVDTNETLAVLQYNSIRAGKDDDFAIRVQKSRIQPILRTGRFEMICTEDTVTIAVIERVSIQNDAGETEVRDAHRCSIKMPRHKAFVTTLAKRLKMLKKGDSFDASQLDKVATIAKRFKTYVNCSDNYASIELRSGTCIVCKVSEMPEFALSYSAMDALFKCGTAWQCNGTNVYTIDANFGVLVTQCRSSDISVMNYFEASESGASLIFTGDYTGLVHLLQKYKGCNLSINLDSKTAVISGNDITVTTTMDISDCRRSEKCKSNEVNLNFEIVRDIVAKLTPNKVTVKVKKYFNQIESDAFTILCK